MSERCNHDQVRCQAATELGLSEAEASGLMRATLIGLAWRHPNAYQDKRAPKCQFSGVRKRVVSKKGGVG